MTNEQQIVAQKLKDATERFEEENLPMILPTWRRLIIEWAELPKQLICRRALRSRKAARQVLSERH